MKKLIWLLPVILALLSSAVLCSCTKSEGYIYVEGKVNIVATTTMIGDLAKEVGGDFVSVTTLMNVGVDPHSYQPKPSDAAALNKADLVILNGLHLEAQMGTVISRIGDKVLVIGDAIGENKLLKGEDGAVDPHIWFDVNLWKSAAGAVGNKLKSVDAENEQAYQTRTETYLNELDVLNQYVQGKVSELSAKKRILVTAHDAFRYYANAYGFEVYAIQGISTETEASATDIQDLANLVVGLKVKAIFIESSVPQETVQSVINAASARGHTVIIGGELFSDSLGDSASSAETYIKTIRKNTDTIVNALK